MTDWVRWVPIQIRLSGESFGLFYLLSLSSREAEPDTRVIAKRRSSANMTLPDRLEEPPPLAVIEGRTLRKPS